MSSNRMLEPIDFTGLDVEQVVVRLIDYAVHLPASDLFISSNETSTAISVRHLGILKLLANVAREDGNRYINHVKAVAGMPVDQKLRPVDGRWVCTIEDNKRIDLRINTVPTLWGEDMAIRLLECDLGLLELANLGFHNRNHENLVTLLKSPSGLILVTGPAGSGKTTTLYACLQSLNDGTRRINTIEDPIEFALTGVRQSQVRPKMDLDFPELLRGVLRQSPDVIMVGEIRDPVTAETAVLAANSGHLVFATLHAAIAAVAVDGMLALGVNSQFLATSLLGALSQRLVRTLCDKCKVAFDLGGATETFRDVRKWLEPGQGEKIFSATGCEHCRQEGFDGRTGVAEVLRVSKAIRRMIIERRSVREIREAAIEGGMLDLRRSALLKVAQGITSTEEMIRMIPTEHLLPDD